MSFNIGDKVKTLRDVFSDTEYNKSGAKNLGREVFVVKEIQWWEQGNGYIVIGVNSDKRKGKVWHHENDLIKIMKQQPTHGGARKGAGRKPGKETVTLSFRVPLDKAEILREKIRKIISKTVT